MKHVSVLLDETINSLNIKEDGIYVDCTLGYAGHSSAILKKIKKGMLYAFDQDEEAREYSENILSKIGKNYEIIPSNFVNLKEELKKRGISKVDGIMFDLGVSSPQLDDAIRGFSFHYDAPLDMRMDKSGKIDAHYIVNNYSYEDLKRIIYEYSDEKYSSLIAKAIVEKRKEKEIKTTLELSNIINESVPFKYKRETNPSRRTFQAIRIEVNNELNILPKTFNDAIDLLNKDGVLSVITFHSKEDKICVDVFKRRAKENSFYKGMPNVPKCYLPDVKVLKKIKPSKEEIDLNKRSRSATLRCCVKLK